MDRPDCLNKATTCIAKTPGKHCHRCMLTARNRTDKQREHVRQEKLKNPTHGKMQLASNASEVRRRAAETRLDNEGFWCPREYRDVNRKLREARMSQSERMDMIAKMIQDDANKPVITGFLVNRIDASHDRMKRQKKQFGSTERSGF